MIDDIMKLITWLDDHKASNNITQLVKVIDSLNILCVTLGEQVSTAYALMNESEDDYKVAFARSITMSDQPVSRAERIAEADLYETKKLWTASKNNYKKLNMFLERIDRVSDSHRQRISVMKSEIKNVI